MMVGKVLMGLEIVMVLILSPSGCFSLCVVSPRAEGRDSVPSPGCLGGPEPPDPRLLFQDIDWVQTEKHVFEQASSNPFLVGLHSCFQTTSR